MAYCGIASASLAQSRVDRADLSAVRPYQARGAVETHGNAYSASYADVIVQAGDIGH